MSIINSQSRQAKVRKIQRSLAKYGAWLLAFSAITSGLGFFFPESRVLQKVFGRSSDIRYQILGSSRANSEILQGIIISNKGGESAKELTIEISYIETLIENKYFDPDIFIDIHDIKVSGTKETLIFKIDQMKSSESRIFYVVVNKKGEFPKVSITHQNGEGLEENNDIPKLFIWLMSIGGASTAILLFILMRRFWRFIIS